MIFLYGLIAFLYTTTIIPAELMQKVSQDFVHFAQSGYEKQRGPILETDTIKQNITVLKSIAQDILVTTEQSGLDILQTNSNDFLIQLLQITTEDDGLLKDIEDYEALTAQMNLQHNQSETPLSALTLACVGSSSETVRSATDAKFPISLASQTIAVEYIYNYFTKKTPQTSQPLKKALLFSLLTIINRCLKEQKNQHKFFGGIEIAAIVPLALTALKGAAGSLIGLYSVHKLFKWFNSGDEAKKELLAQRIEMRYKDFCEKYKKSIDKLETKIERIQEDAHQIHRQLDQAQDAIGSLRTENHKEVEKIHAEIAALETELKKIFSTDASLKQRKIEELESKIQQAISQTQTFQDEDIAILGGLKSQLEELKTDITQIKQINDAMTTQLHKKALPKIVEIASEFHTFATKEQLRYLTIIKCLMTNKEMRKIIDKASAVLPE